MQMCYGYLMASLRRHLVRAPLAVRTLGELALGQEALIWSAVPALVRPFVERPTLLQGTPEVTHGSLVVGLAGADEVREGDRCLGQGLAEQSRNAGAELRGRRPCRSRGLLDLQPVLVGT